MKKASLLTAAIATIALIALTLTLTLTRKHPAEPSAVAKVGVILPLTGILSQMGHYEQQAMELALSDARKPNIPPMHLVFEDGKGDNKAVAAAASKLLDVDHVQMIIASTTGAALTAQPIADRHQIPLLAFCMGSDVASQSPTTIRFYIGIEEESKAIIDYLRTLPRDTRVGILHASVAVWTTAVNGIYEPFFKDFFTRPALIEEYGLSDKDFRAQLTKFKSANVSVIVLLGYGFEYPALFGQMDQLGIRNAAQIVGGWGFLYTSLAPAELDGIRVAGPTYVFNKATAGKAFEQRFLNTYRRAPNFDAAFAYEVIKEAPTILDILKQDGPVGLKRRLAELGTVQGVMGDYRFTSDGNMIVNTAVGVFKDGLIVAQ